MANPKINEGAATKRVKSPYRSNSGPSILKATVYGMRLVAPMNQNLHLRFVLFLAQRL
jgi:hypothetical protein